MGKRGISIAILAAFVVIVGVIIIDFRSKRPDRIGANPYEYNVDEYRNVDKKLVHYKETKNFPLNGIGARAIDFENGKIWLTGENSLRAITPEGVQVLNAAIPEKSECMKVLGEIVFIGFRDHVEKYSAAGEQLQVWDVPGKNTVLTSMDVSGDILFVADAGNRRVLVYDFDGGLKGEFFGQAESNAGHGFIVPSANFDLVVNSLNELWVVNPGKHALENYNAAGEMQGFWQKSSMEIEGFTGCCNPAEISALPNGDIVTSEKGMVRIKVYDRSGKMLSVVAPPAKFENEGHAPEVTTDNEGNIYALDFDREVIRVFEKKKDA